MFGVAGQGVGACVVALPQTGGEVEGKATEAERACFTAEVVFAGIFKVLERDAATVLSVGHAVTDIGDFQKFPFAFLCPVRVREDMCSSRECGFLCG